jgi:excisionase family DNA binding protein
MSAELEQDNRAINRRPFLSREEAAELLGVSHRTLRRWELRGQLPAVRINRRVIRYRRCDIDDMAEKFLAGGGT